MSVPASPPAFLPGFRLLDGSAVQGLSDGSYSAQSGLTAFAGGVRANTPVLTSVNAQFSTVATTADSTLLPPAYAGLEVCIQNDGANSMQVFASGSDTINGTAGATGVALAAAATAKYHCVITGQWKRFVSS